MKWTGPADDQTRKQGKYTLRAEQMIDNSFGEESWWYCCYYKGDMINDGRTGSATNAKQKAIRIMLKHKP